jgi:hypothetical protein
MIWWLRCNYGRPGLVGDVQVEDVLSGAHSQGSDMSGVLADERVRQAYDAAAGGSAAAAAGDGGGGSSRRKPVEGDCPICFEELKVLVGLVQIWMSDFLW